MTEAPRIMVAEARFYPDIADALAGGAIAALDEAGAVYERFPVPGVFEIPAAIRMAVRANDAGRRRFDGYLAL
ncbi:MAG TPA: 6,7-dimethyl-8-ribityllumazine synthase, partial [Dongiaceae bacterium]|nr:6,7-dimethyl-8-ribityllumazine synthase [Dongiaceae bacterium]